MLRILIAGKFFNDHGNGKSCAAIKAWCSLGVLDGINGVYVGTEAASVVVSVVTTGSEVSEGSGNDVLDGTSVAMDSLVTVLSPGDHHRYAPPVSTVVVTVIVSVLPSMPGSDHNMEERIAAESFIDCNSAEAYRRSASRRNTMTRSIGNAMNCTTLQDL